MAKNLLIVESPAKAKTIEKYLGKDFKVKSSYGHIRDLDKGNKGVNIERDFHPNYVVSPEKTKVVKELKDWVKKVEEVWLATDEDREGEAISWHLCEVLGLDPHTTKRIVFREITKSAIERAIVEPRTVDLNLVDAQQARRILDRLVGFDLSKLLWHKVKGKLSAGRVQSVAVKLIVDKERQIQKHTSLDFYKSYAFFNVLNAAGNKTVLRAEYNSKIETEDQAKKILEACKNTNFAIQDIKIKPLTRKPSAPFTTSTLQQDASRKLGFGVKRTMSVAQKLYEQGLITYMRTDSTSLSNMALGTIKDEILSEYGEEYSELRQYKSKSSNAQEAHEAIRPTYIQRHNGGKDRDEQRLYELIWKRTISSQMSVAKIEKTTVNVCPASDNNIVFKAEGEVIKFDGFLKVYLESTDEDEEDSKEKAMLPPLKLNQELDLKEITALQRFTRPPSRYTEASLVKKLEELGIGRPSTYAPTISKIMEKERGYVTKESREGKEREYTKYVLLNDELTKLTETEITGATSNRLYSTDLGMVVTDFLSLHFDDIINYNFTKEIEEKFDVIAEGKSEWKKMLKDFYFPFQKHVENTIETADRAKGRRVLGVDPKSGHSVLVQITRYGPAAMIGTVEEVGEEGKPRFANLRPGMSMETVTLEEVLELFKLPRELGEYKGSAVSIGAGRFGPYVKFADKFISMPKDKDPLKITLDEAQVLIDKKIEEDAPIHTYDDKPITKGVGRFGPFLKWNGMFINVNKKYDFDNLSIADIEELVKAKIEKEANRYIKQWPEDKLALENGRWGPFIRFKKKSIKLPKIDGNRMTQEQAAELKIEEIKALVEAEIPNAFPKKKEKKTKKKK
jgi:DNA topoisomerase-1